MDVDVDGGKVALLSIFEFAAGVFQTRMQSLSPENMREGMRATFLRMVRQEGVFRPVKGMSAVVLGAGPSHALYFSCYEYLKDMFVQKTTSTRYHTLIYGKISTYPARFISPQPYSAIYRLENKSET